MNANRNSSKPQKPEAVRLSWFQSLLKDKRKMTWLMSAVCLLLAAVIILIVVFGGQTAETDEDTASTADPRKYETIKNGDFRYTFLEDEDNSIYRYPMAPDSWTSEVKVGNAVDEDGHEIVPAQPDNAAGANTRFGVLNTEAEAYAALTEDDIGYIGREPAATRYNPGKPSTTDEDKQNDFSVSREKDAHENILMLYAGEPGVSKAGINYKSSSFYVTAGEFAEVSVWVRTYGVTGADNAHIKIQTGDVDELFFGNIVAADWTLYRFFVSTSLTYGQTVTLHLSLGYESTGTVDNYASGYAFFSDISIRYINEREYSEAKNIVDSETMPDFPFIKYHNFRTEAGGRAIDYVNGKFNDPATVVYVETAGKLYGKPAPHARPTTTGNDTDKSGIVSLSDNEYEQYFEDHPFSSVNNALMIYNANYSSFGFSFVPDTANPDTYISVGINRYYKISVWIKTDEMVTGRGASVYLMNKKYDIDRDRYPSSYFEGIDTTKIDQSGKEYNSGWVEYSFYVQGSGAEVQNFYLELWLGKRGREGAAASDADRAKGYAFFANVSVTTITMYEYQNVSGGETSKTLAISMKTSSSSVSNGSFDTATNNDLYSYPLNPSNWSLYYSGHNELKYLTDDQRYTTQDSEAAIPLPIDRGAGSAGIINTSVTLEEILNYYEKPSVKEAELKAALDPNDIWEAQKTGGQDWWDALREYANPGATGPNVLMIANHGLTAFGFRSANISLEANSYYRISIKVKTFGISDDGVNIYLSGLYGLETDENSETVMDEDGNPVPSDTIHRDAQFNAINTQSATGTTYAENVFEMSGTSLVTHGYTEYSFLVITGDMAKTVNLELWLGGREYNLDNRTSGYAFFDQARIEKLQVDDNGDTDKYADALEKLRLQMPALADDEEYETDDYNTFFANLSIIDYSMETVEPEPWEDPGVEEEPFDFDILLIPSIIIAVVLLFAVFSVLGRKIFKKIKWTKKIQPSSDYKRKNIKYTSYDIDDTEDTTAEDTESTPEPETSKRHKEKPQKEYLTNKKSDSDDTEL